MKNTFKSISELIIDQARKKLDQPFIIANDGEVVVNGDEFVSFVASLSSYLQDNNARGIVPVVLSRRWEYIASICAINQLGLAFVPLTDKMPAQRIEYIKKECEANFVIDENVVHLAKRYKQCELSNKAEEDGVALIFYTSGSTGTPKGVVYSNHLLSEIITTDRSFNDYSNWVIGATASFSFAVSVTTIYSALAKGYLVHLLSDELKGDSRLLEEYVIKHAINHIFLPPSLLRHFSDGVGCLKRVISIGERLANIAPRSYEIWNMYGLTETHAVTSFVLDKCYDNTPIGKPNPNCRVYLVDENGALSNKGEIVIAGTLANGYFKDEEKSAKHFKKNIFDDDPAFPRVMYSGDIAYRDENDNLVYIGRKDKMVKINGQRVEPSEAEFALLSFKNVKEAVVKAFENEYGQVYLVGYFTSNDKLNSDEIKAYLKTTLNSYMVPTYILQIDSFPKNVNGKIDRNALEAPNAAIFQNAYVAPTTKNEKAVCHAFENVLKIKRVGINDDFFTLGGDSILVMALLSELGVKSISAIDIMEQKTPAKIAKLFETSKSKQIDDSSLKEIYPLNAGQLGVYLACLNNKESLMYNIPFYYELGKDVDSKRLKNAIIRVVNHYSIFKVAVKEINGEIVMQKLSKPHLDLDILHLDHASFISFKDEFVKPFTFENGNLTRFRIVVTNSITYLFLDLHHIIFDGSSLSILMKAISDEYEGNDLIQEGVSIFDFNTRDALLDETKSQKAEQFFENNLTSEYDFSLMEDEIEHKDEIKNASTIRFSLANNVSIVDLEPFCKANALTEASYFLSCFTYSLTKMSGGEGFSLTTVNSGRHSFDLMASLGMYVKTMPLSIKIDEANSSLLFVKDIQNKLHEAIKFDYYPFQKIAKKFDFNNDTMFVYQGEMFDNIVFSNKKIRTDFIDTNCALAKITLNVYKNNGGYEASLVYRNDLYSKDTIGVLVSLFKIAVNQFINNKVLSGIDLLDQNTLTRLNSYNLPKCIDDSITCLDMFKKAVELHPDNVALVSSDNKYTYREVDKMSDALALELQRKGIKKNDVVAIITNRNEAIAIAPIAVIKCGAIYQPLDSTYPSERLTYMVKDSEAKIIIAHKSLRNLIELDIDTIYLDDFDYTKTEDIKYPTINKNDGYALLYTSGSTGLPKGCIISHGNISTFVQASIAHFGYDENANIACYASFGFDASMGDLAVAISAGATLHIIPLEMRLNLDEVNAYFNANNITHAFMTTQIGREFALSQDNHSLKHLVMGGEALAPFKPNTSYAIHNAYGPTETSVWVTSYNFNTLMKNIPIGKTASDCKMYVVDKYLRRLPPLVPGELLIAGPQVSAGYLKLEEKTKEVFINNPFDDDHRYKNVYRTGDVVRYLNDGNIQFVGRKDSQVKIRGFRIELSEVEEIIRRFKNIKDATVCAFDDENIGKYIVAYVVSDVQIDVDKLNEFIKSEKPSYMVPSITMQIDAIPLNQNQKVNKKLLPKPERKSDNLIKPRNEKEQKIFDVVSSLIASESFSVTDDIFDIGINSISSIRLCALLTKSLNKLITVAELKENYTIERLSSFFGDEISLSSDSSEAKRYPLTKTQEGLFYECLNKPNSTVYNIPYLMKISKDVDISRLKKSIVKVISAHPYVLSEIIMNEEGIFTNRYSTFTIDDIDDIEITSIDEYKETIIKPFSLENSCLFRVSVLRSINENYLFFDFHHLIFDGTSLAILLADINKVYEGKEIEVEEFGEGDFALSEAELRNSPLYEKAKRYYESTFDGLDGVSLPVGDNVINEEGYALVEETYNDFDFKKLKSYLKNLKITENAFFTTAFGILLNKYSQDEMPLFTTIYNGRNDPRIIDSIGMFVKTFPIMCDTRINDVKELLKKTANQISSSQAHDIYSFMEINRDLGISADTIFVYQGEGFMPKTFCCGDFDVIKLHLDTSKSILNMEVCIDNGALQLNCSFDKSKYTDEFIKSFLKSYYILINELLVKEKLDDISYVDDEELVKLDSINDNVVSYEDKTIVELIEESINKYPDNIAAVYKDDKITYAELDKRSKILAKHLINKGIKPGDIVAILSDRDINMVVCPFAILRARAIYQPLDSTYPKERLTFMVKDSNAKILLTPKRLRDLIDTEIETIYSEDLLALNDLDIALPVCELHDGFTLLYTSGSTGLPKGCILEHYNLNATLVAYRDYAKMTPSSRNSIFASFGFDACMLDTFLPLICGASCYIIDKDMRLELNKLCEYFNENKITHAAITTQVGREFATNFDFKTLEYLMVGGEALTPLNPPRYKMLNAYGPTEATVFVTLQCVDRLYKNVPIGKAIAEVYTYVVDKNLKRVPIGMPGELCVAGPQIGRGYLNRIEKTKEVFITNPFTTSERYKPMYRTGDIVRFLSDGRIQFIGRKDSQVKIRGFRVELSEVEEVIRRFKGIKDATVVAFNEASGGKYLAAYVVSDTKVDFTKLKEFILSEKPSYMVPSSMMQIDKIPLNQNNKVNKKALPVIEKTNDVVYVKPDNQVEADFANMMGEILSINPFSVTSSFFEMGGSSISASKLLVMALAKNYTISYADIFSFATPRLLAEHCLKNIASSGVAGDSDSVEHFDYFKINEYIESQSIETIDEAIKKDPSIVKDKMGNILLSGATGFLGIHVLKEYLTNYKGKVYCLIRGKDEHSTIHRLKSRLVYYFFDDFEEAFESKRIVCINATINDADLFEKIRDLDFDTLINCAACVKHFVSDDSLYKTNTLGVRNLLDICRRLNKRFVQTSTYSVSGYKNDKISHDIYSEQDLYINQDIDNEYIRTKLLAERDCLEACLKGENVKVLRLGNLMPRFSDYEFQINFITNGFMRDLRGATALGYIPFESLSNEVDLSPIDETAKAVLKISDADLPMSIYHVYNNYKVRVIDIAEGLVEAGFDLTYVSEKDYKQKIKEAIERAKNNDSASDLIGGLVAYKDGKTNSQPVLVEVENELTTKALYRLSYRWPILDKEYISKSIDNLSSLRFFNKDTKL